MLHLGGNGGVLVAPPGICGSAEIETAHRQMRRHRACRIDRCGWKWVAFYTLVRHGRIVPQELSPRERAHRRGIEFPVERTGPTLPADEAPAPWTFQQVLDGLGKLAEDLRVGPGDGCRR
ncbi:hypothetical protein ACRS5S_10730 [Nocardia asiatica]|uniref:hypothetical protein n=1 Tax=Nocardia asiatica TaxID=209252 RepID=UPI002455F0CC|nr:hypothetical protein [Nocardia asiatica]